MKKTLILAGVASMLLACNNDSGNNTTNGDTSNHEAHEKTSNQMKHSKNKNAILKTMDTMMQGMHGFKSTGNNDIDFAEMMIKHHQGAVEMSKVEIKEGTNAELRAFAQKVIDDQQKEITFMQDVISESSKTTSSNSAAFQEALNSSMMSMMNDNIIIYNNIDKDFAAQMIPHHESAVDMAKAYLEYGQESGLRTLCQNIITSQSKEINWLRDWLSRNK